MGRAGLFNGTVAGGWNTSSGMPRACPVEPRAGGILAGAGYPPGCHGLAPWSLTLGATPQAALLPRSLSSNEREAPRDKPVASRAGPGLEVAASASLHGASSWHPAFRSRSGGCAAVSAHFGHAARLQPQPTRHRARHLLGDV